MFSLSRSLDISSSNERHGHCFKSPDAQLAELVTALPNLTHLDISGTNLAGERKYSYKHQQLFLSQNTLSNIYLHSNHIQFIYIYFLSLMQELIP